MTQTSRNDFIATPAGDDLVIYDQSRHVTHHLNQTATHIWREAERSIDADVIANRLALPVDTVRDALYQLARADLLAIPASMGRQNRRGLLKRAAMAGVVAPVVISVTAPMAAAQASTCPGTWAPNISISFGDGGTLWTVFASISGFCPNTRYNAWNSTMRPSGEILGPFASGFVTGPDGSVANQYGTLTKGQGFSTRYDSDFASSGWVAAPD